MCFVRAMDSIELVISSCTWVITENWSVLAFKDSFVNFVGKVDNILLVFYFCDSLKQSIKFSFCGTSWDVTWFPWFPIDQQISKENAGSRSSISSFLHEAKSLSVKISTSEFHAPLSIGELFTGPPCSELREKNGISRSFEVIDYSSSQYSVFELHLKSIGKKLMRHMKNLVLSR